MLQRFDPRRRHRPRCIFFGVVLCAVCERPCAGKDLAASFESMFVSVCVRVLFPFCIHRLLSLVWSWYDLLCCPRSRSVRSARATTPTQQVLEAIAAFPNICRQLHLPAQSGSTAVLVSNSISEKKRTS